MIISLASSDAKSGSCKAGDPIVLQFPSVRINEHKPPGNIPVGGCSPAPILQKGKKPFISAGKMGSIGIGRRTAQLWMRLSRCPSPTATESRPDCPHIPTWSAGHLIPYWLGRTSAAGG